MKGHERQSPFLLIVSAFGSLILGLMEPAIDQLEHANNMQMAQFSRDNKLLLEINGLKLRTPKATFGLGDFLFNVLETEVKLK